MSHELADLLKTHLPALQQRLLAWNFSQDSNGENYYRQIHASHSSNDETTAFYSMDFILVFGHGSQARTPLFSYGGSIAKTHSVRSTWRFIILSQMAL
jgi:hypothetical protein